MKVIGLTRCLLLTVFSSLFDAIKPISFTALTHRRPHYNQAHTLRGWLSLGTALYSVTWVAPADSPPISAAVARRERDPALFVDMRVLHGCDYMADGLKLSGINTRVKETVVLRDWTTERRSLKASLLAYRFLKFLYSVF